MDLRRSLRSSVPDERNQSGDSMKVEPAQAEAKTRTQRSAFTDCMNSPAQALGNTKGAGAVAGSTTTVTTAAAAVPTIGARCAVHFALEKDYFGVRRSDDGKSERLMEGWFPAKVEAVNSSKKTITARFEDNTVSTDVPWTDIRLLQSGQTDDDAHLDYWSSSSSSPAQTTSNSTGTTTTTASYRTDEIFCIRRPDELRKGDLVSALFQQGQVAANPNAWYRGRVLDARTYKDKDAGAEWGLVDVGYDDGDFERNVPYKCSVKGKMNSTTSSSCCSVTLLQRGEDDPSWLFGLTVQLQSLRLHCTTGIVQAVPPPTRSVSRRVQTLRLTVQYAQKGSAPELRSYDDIVQALSAENARQVQQQEQAKAVHCSQVMHVAGTKQALPLAQMAVAMGGMSNQHAEAVAMADQDDDMDDDDDDDDMDDDVDLVEFVKKRQSACEAKYNDLTTDDDASKMSSQSRQQRSSSSGLTRECKASAKAVAAAAAAAAAADLKPRAARRTIAKRSVAIPAATASAETTSASQLPPSKAPSRASKTTVATKKTKTTKLCCDGPNVQAVAETFWKKLQLDEVDSMQPARPLKIMDHPTAQYVAQNINSSCAILASEHAIFVGSLHDRMPNDKLWKSILDLTFYGPDSDGKHFPDVQQMARCMDYWNFVFSKPGALKMALEHIDKKFVENNQGKSFAEAFVQQMTSIYYMAPGDGLRGTVGSVKRISDSAHAKACLAKVYATLLRRQLVPFMAADQESSGNQDNNLGYKTLPIVHNIIAARRGAKDALEQSVRACVQLWITYGPYYMCEVEAAMTDSKGVDQDLLGCTFSNLASLFKSLGVVISCLAWLYGKEANEGADALADICHQIMQHELASADWTQIKPLLADMVEEKYIEKVKLCFLMSLQSEMIPQVQPKLANRFQIATLYNIINGW